MTEMSAEVVKQAVIDGLAEHVTDEMELLIEVRAMARASRIILRVLVIFAGMLVLLSLSLGYLLVSNGQQAETNGRNVRASTAEMQAELNRVADARQDEHEQILRIVCAVAADVPEIIRLPREC